MTKDANLKKYSVYLAAGTGAFLLIPLIAMQFSAEVVWTLSDFIFAGIFIFGTGMAYKLITLKSEKTIFRVAVGSALFSGFALIWINGAVGIIGSENNEFNILYYLVIMIGIVGAFLSRFKAKGLARTMFAMVLGQTAIMAAALFTGMANVTHSSVFEIIGVNALFITLFAVSGLLFNFSVEDEIKDQEESRS